MYANQPLGNHRGPAPDEKCHWSKNDNSVQSTEMAHVPPMHFYDKRRCNTYWIQLPSAPRSKLRAPQTSSPTRDCRIVIAHIGHASSVTCRVTSCINATHVVKLKLRNWKRNERKAFKETGLRWLIVYFHHYISCLDVLIEVLIAKECLSAT